MTITIHRLGAACRVYPFRNHEGDASAPWLRLTLPDGSRLAIRTPGGTLARVPASPIDLTPDREDIVTPDRGGRTAWWAICDARRGVPGYAIEPAGGP